MDNNFDIEFGYLKTPEDEGSSVEEPIRKTVKKRTKPVEEKLYVASCNTQYRFLCDGTTVRLLKGVSPQGLNPGQTDELLTYGRIKEVT